MNPETDQKNPPAPIQTPPSYTEPTSQKILRETSTAVATVGMITGLIATIKGIFGKR